MKKKKKSTQLWLAVAPPQQKEAEGPSLTYYTRRAHSHLRRGNERTHSHSKVGGGGEEEEQRHSERGKLSHNKS